MISPATLRDKKLLIPIEPRTMFLADGFASRRNGCQQVGASQGLQFLAIETCWAKQPRGPRIRTFMGQAAWSVDHEPTATEETDAKYSEHRQTP
jgi:hypothetical protein